MTTDIPTIRREKIGTGFYQSGHGRGFKRTASVYLIDGYCYAKSKMNWGSDFRPLSGELEGYVRVNAAQNINTKEYTFWQVTDTDHKPLKTA